MTEKSRRGTVGDVAEADEMRFGFGANWADYIERNYSEERVEISRQHLLGFMKLGSLEGKSFLDIGCGSGLHSLAAWRSGAARIFSFDYDADSVATTKKLHQMSGSPSNWIVVQGSVLDDEFMRNIPKADVVYSWGVLHHTGAMWKAIENAGRCVAANGMFYIALYAKDVYVSPPAEYWLKVKRQYNLANPLQKRWMEWRYAWRDSIRGHLIRGKSPLKFWREYKQSRGMSYWHDVKDWLGGWPMEFAGNKETELFAREKLGLDLVHIRAGEGNTEFLFRPLGARNYWDSIAAATPLHPIYGPFSRGPGKAWIVDLSVTSTGLGDPKRFMLYEDGSPLGWPNVPASSIEAYGGGRYRLDGATLIFSTSDNTDPGNSGRRYEFRANFF